MLFDERVVPGIIDGTVTCAFRRWRRRAAKPGSTHRVFGTALVAIDAVAVVSAEDITAGDARAAGFESLAELEAYLRGAPTPAGDGDLYRVDFHYVGPIEEPTVGAAEMPGLIERLRGMDRRSSHGPWTAATLRMIAERPRTRAAVLASALGRETLPFKADVRRLKHMGLTRSLETGYELTDAGRSAMEALEHDAPRHRPGPRPV